MRSDESSTRRIFLHKIAFSASLLVPAAGKAQSVALVNERDPQAVALGYVSDAARADTQKYPKFVTGQGCCNCALFQGKTIDSTGSCPLFTGKQVSRAGWCSAYAARGALGQCSAPGLDPAPSNLNSMVRMVTSLGVLDVSLFDKEAPLTVRNFIGYVEGRRYDQTIIHRAVKNFVVQGGGFKLQNDWIVSIPRTLPIDLEYSDARPNARGTIAMARTADPNSATSEWLINTVDNTTTLGSSNNGGYAVFGRVTEPGMSVVGAVEALPVTNIGDFDAVPLLVAPVAPVQAQDLVFLTSTIRLSQPPTNADRAFNYLEATYWRYLKPPGSVSTTGSAGGVTYYFRYYQASNSYLGISLPGNEVFYLVPDVGPNLTKFLSLTDLMPRVTAAGY